MTAKAKAALAKPRRAKPARVTKYTLRLYVAGMTPRSRRAIANIKHICEVNLKGRYSLQVIDLYQHPELARQEQIVALPTLIRKLPEPLRRIVGDLLRSRKGIARAGSAARGLTGAVLS
ncbi:MAG: circadian clock KaiB family protein [Myxococcales bacterium]|nr:circadian clock KaiB family protein [Myxococcales bacterium]